MALYDIVDEIAQKQVVKTDMGDNRMMGLVVGKVSKNHNKDLPGRVCVEILSRDAKANEFLWARVAQPSSGKKWGHYFLPEVGDQVIVGFEEGNIERPYILGCVPLMNDNFLKKAADADNQFKKIVSTHGNTICMVDNKDDKNGEKDRIEIITAKDAHRVVMDNDKKLIDISDKANKNEIKIATESGKGTIEILTEQKLTIKVGDNITVTMNGSNGTVEINATKISLKSSDSTIVEANGRLALSGASAEIKGNSNTKLESGGTVSISGTPINLG